MKKKHYFIGASHLPIKRKKHFYKELIRKFYSDEELTKEFKFCKKCTYFVQLKTCDGDYFEYCKKLTMRLWAEVIKCSERKLKN